MNIFDNGFYDLLTRALGAGDNAHIQGFLDDVLATKYSELQIDGFSFAPDMQLDFTFEQLVKEVGLSVMAQYTDLDSPAKPISTEGAEAYTGKIPRMKMVEYWNEDKYRKMLIAEERFGASSDRVKNAAFAGLFNTTDKLIGAHTNSLTYQRHQMVSKREFTLTASNNPLGIALPTISAHVPTANINQLAGTKRWWTSVANGVYSVPGADCDPIGDLQKIVREAKRTKGVRGHFEVDTNFMDQVLDHPKVSAAIVAKFSIAAGTQIAAANANLFSRDARVEALAQIIGAPIKEIDSVVAVESISNGKPVRNSFNAFEDNVLVYVPDGSLGEILTVEPLKIAGGNYGEFYGGRLLLTVGFDAVKKCQSFSTEMTSLVVPDKPNCMWYIHPYGSR